MAHYVDSDDVRTMFSKAMSDMYRSEVPLYGDLLELVHDVNAETLRKDPNLRANLEQRHELGKLSLIHAYDSEPTACSARSTLMNSNPYVICPSSTRLGKARRHTCRNRQRGASMLWFSE